MFTYVCLGTNDLRRAARFYDATFGALGLERCNTRDVDWDKTSVGWGTYKDGGAREVALWVCRPFRGRPRPSTVRGGFPCRLCTRPGRKQIGCGLSRLHVAAVKALL